MSHLKLRAPDQLPAHGLTLQQFKPWKNHLKNYLRQDTDNTLFFPGKIYATWRAQEDHEERIHQLHAQDPDAARLRERPNQQHAQLQRDLQDLLDRRNAQLAKFLSLITMLCHYTEQDQVDQRATSLEWIFTFLEQKYNLSNKGANFLKIGSISYKQGTPYDAFYKELRSAINDSLLSQGDILQYRDNAALEEDERFTPTLENVAVLWALQLIDPRLPAQVHKTFGHQLKNNTRLIDIHQQVFDQIPELLQDIDLAEHNRASTINTATTMEEEPTLNAAFLRRGNPSRFRGRFPRGRGNTSNDRGRQPQRKFCRICYLSGSSAYTSHDMGTCRQLTRRDMESLQSRLNAISIESAEDQPPEPVLVPGWDFPEEKEEDDQYEQPQ
jgi:hypothetical protein